MHSNVQKTRPKAGGNKTATERQREGNKKATRRQQNGLFFGPEFPSKAKLANGVFPFITSCRSLGRCCHIALGCNGLPIWGFSL